MGRSVLLKAFGIETKMFSNWLWTIFLLCTIDMASAGYQRWCTLRCPGKAEQCYSIEAKIDFDQRLISVPAQYEFEVGDALKKKEKMMSVLVDKIFVPLYGVRKEAEFPLVLAYRLIGENGEYPLEIESFVLPAVITFQDFSDTDVFIVQINKTGDLNQCVVKDRWNTVAAALKRIQKLKSKGTIAVEPRDFVQHSTWFKIENISKIRHDSKAIFFEFKDFGDLGEMQLKENLCSTIIVDVQGMPYRLIGIVTGRILYIPQDLEYNATFLDIITNFLGAKAEEFKSPKSQFKSVMKIIPRLGSAGGHLDSNQLLRHDFPYLDNDTRGAITGVTRMPMFKIQFFDFGKSCGSPRTTFMLEFLQIRRVEPLSAAINWNTQEIEFDKTQFEAVTRIDNFLSNDSSKRYALIVLQSRFVSKETDTEHSYLYYKLCQLGHLKTTTDQHGIDVHILKFESVETYDSYLKYIQ